MGKKKEAYGVDTHLERQTVARERKEDAATIPHSTGDGWSNQLTKPKEFQFNHRVKIKSLSKPITPAAVEAKMDAIADSAFDQSRHSYSMSQMSTGSASAEWMRRAAEKEQSESA